MSGRDGAAPPVRCASCRFWAAYNATGGVCRRYAPGPAESADTVAHWPETFADEGCGEGMPGASGVGQQVCADCAFWMPSIPEGGLQPVDFNDQPRAWWRHAGRCVRHAPSPQAAPGVRLMWPATHGSDSCGQGAPRGARAPAPDSAET